MSLSTRPLALGIRTHYVDHLVPLCELMDAELVVPDAQAAEIAVGCYPNVEPRIDQPWLKRGALAGRVVFYSQLLSREDLRRGYGGDDPPRVVFCPHGFSEKRSRWSADAASQDVFLVHGQFGLDQLRDWDVLQHAERYVITGNLRYSYYQRHRAFFEAAAARLIGGREPGRRTIFYAPTWDDAVGSTSVFDMLQIMIRGLPAEYDLVIKMHPLMENHARCVDALYAALGPHPRVTLLRNNPLTFPLLERADIYVGDMSSLAYDFLVFDRPMYFLNQTYGRPTDTGSSRLFECGVVVTPQEYGEIYHFIEHHAEQQGFSERRRALWDYVHDRSRAEADIRRELLAAVEGPAPSWMHDSAWSCQ